VVCLETLRNGAWIFTADLLTEFSYWALILTAELLSDCAYSTVNLDCSAARVLCVLERGIGLLRSCCTLRFVAWNWTADLLRVCAHWGVNWDSRNS